MMTVMAPLPALHLKSAFETIPGRLSHTEYVQEICREQMSKLDNVQKYCLVPPGLFQRLLHQPVAQAWTDGLIFLVVFLMSNSWSRQHPYQQQP